MAQRQGALLRRVNETTLRAENLICEVLSEVSLPDDVVQGLIELAAALGEIRDLVRSASDEAAADSSADRSLAS